jgi:hypothetical protein
LHPARRFPIFSSRVFAAQEHSRDTACAVIRGQKSPTRPAVEAFFKAEKLEQFDFAGAIFQSGKPVHLIIPIAVVDELDRLKEHHDPHIRWRAGYTLAVIDRVLKSEMQGVLHEGDTSQAEREGDARPKVSMELLLDPPGHVRLPIADDEIVDRALSVQRFAESPVSFLTFDTGQATRARVAGLAVLKLHKDIGEEPATRSKRH